MDEQRLDFDRTPQDEPRDRTKLLWMVVGILMIIMVVALWFSQQPKPNVSEVQAKHILVRCKLTDPVERNRAMERITEIRERILKGESFESLAKQYSEDTMTARRGGDLGWEPRGTYDDAIDAFCWTADIGKLSDILQSSHGFHLVVVTARHISDAEKYEQELDQRTRENLKKTGGAGAK